MRVEDPTKFGEIMLHLAMNGRTPNSRQLYAMFGHDEHTFKLTNRPMVHLTYQTAFVDDAGKLHVRDDIYGFDARIHAIMHSDERRIADVAPPQDPKRDLATAKTTRKSCAGSSGARRTIRSCSSSGCSASYSLICKCSMAGPCARPSAFAAQSSVAIAPEPPRSRPFLAMFANS